MQPQSPQNQVGTSASLPPLAPVQNAQMPIPQAAPAAQPQPTMAISAADQAKIRAKQAVAQYQNDPFRLSAALQQVKAEYIAQQFNVSVNPADN